MFKVYIMVGLGGALGSMLRLACSSFIAQRIGDIFPLGTLSVNLLGSFLIALIATVTDPEGRLLVSPLTRQFLMLGLLGGFTTFSSFSLQTLNLWIDGEFLYSGLNVVLSILLCIGGAGVGVILGHWLNQGALS